VLIVIVALAAAAWFGWNRIYGGFLEPMDANDDYAITVEVPAGATTADIAEILKQEGLIPDTFWSSYVYKYHSKKMGYDGQYKQGEFSMSRSMTVDEMADIMIQGNSAEVMRFTIPEGYNITQIKNTLVSDGIVDEAEFTEELVSGEFDYAFLEDCPDGEERLEGFLYPETYEVYADASAHDVIDRMLSQFDQLFTEEFTVRAADIGMTVRDVVTLASIIEREAKVAEERPVMAGVFYNRLEQGMRLESCATVQFILGEPKEFLTIADTQIESPYNTYLHEGLPPGPICSPRIESIEAALYPDENDYLYFVVNEKLDGSHTFSRTLSEHDAAAARYRQAVNNQDAVGS